MSDSPGSVVVAALIVLIFTLITVIITLSLWLLKLRRRLYKESQVNSDVVPSQNDEGQQDEICSDVGMRLVLLFYPAKFRRCKGVLNLHLMTLQYVVLESKV